jgi:predicted molibdopterin-dependent oxidoreductase YjgC
MADRIKRGEIKALIVMAEDLSAHPSLADASASVDTLIVLGAHDTVTAKQANVLLPMSTWAESEGTFTNTLHRVQRFEPAVVTKENLRSMGMKMSRWDKFGAPNDRWSQGEQRNCRPAWQILRSIAQQLGTTWNYTASSDVFTDLAAHVQQFNGMSYELLNAYHGLVLGKASSPDPVGVVYESHVLKPQ